MGFKKKLKIKKKNSLTLEFFNLFNATVLPEYKILLNDKFLFLLHQEEQWQYAFSVIL